MTFNTIAPPCVYCGRHLALLSPVPRSRHRKLCREKDEAKKPTDGIVLDFIKSLLTNNPGVVLPVKHWFKRGMKD